MTPARLCLLFETARAYCAMQTLRFTVLLFAALLTCKPTDVPVTVSAIVLFKVGSASAAGKDIQSGDILRKGTVITTGAQSLLDLQIREAKSTITLRIQPDSTFVLEARAGKDGQVISPILQSGSMLSRVERLSGSEAYEVRTPSAIAAVRGTKFEAQVAADGSARVTVHEGKVAARPRAAAVENLPPALVEKTPELSALVNNLEKSETVVESGQQVQVDRKTGEDLVRSAGVDAVLARPEVSGLTADSKPEDIEKARASLQTHFAARENQERARAAAEKPVPAAPAVKVEEEELKRKLQEYDEFIARQGAAAANEAEAQKAAAAPQAEQRAVQMRRIESIMGKSSETLVLRNGQRIQGVIIQQGADYIVLTPEGRVFYPGGQVASLEF